MNKEQHEAFYKALRSSPDDLRKEGWTVAVHNDYRLDGKANTFWLLTKKIGELTVALKGEGATDWEALDSIRAQNARLTDDHHHAPLCPANHYHGARAPTGQCSCGAVAQGVRMKRGDSILKELAAASKQPAITG
jgi:hypothetical protein